MSDRVCPVPGCSRALGTTRNGNPFLLCPRHYARLSNDLRLKLWRVYGAWQRIERKYLAELPGMRPPALLDARTLAIKTYLEVRDDCVRKAGQDEPQQLEMA